MKFRNLLICGAVVAMIVGAGCATTNTGTAGREIAADLGVLPNQPSFQNLFDLSSVAEHSTYYQLMKNKFVDKLEKLSTQSGRTRDNAGALKNGEGLAVKLNDANFNVHVNYPKNYVGGRSYGLTNLAVGDWSDAMYLKALASVYGNLNNFYPTLIFLLGACDPVGMSKLSGMTERVANNFLAIYTAEQYRAFEGQGRAARGWDDALFQVTMLGAFHGGQSKFIKYYNGNFQDWSWQQHPGSFPEGHNNDGKPSAKQGATMVDYWQFGPNTQSGIHKTRFDYETMGLVISEYEATVRKNPNYDRVQKAMKAQTRNLIAAVSQYFTQNRAQGPETKELAFAMDAFLADVHADAEKITQWAAQNRAHFDSPARGRAMPDDGGKDQGGLERLMERP